MPIYEYQCEDCGYIFDEVVLKNKPIKISSHCPKCKEDGKSSIAKKIISKSSFVIHGFNALNNYSATKGENKND